MNKCEKCGAIGAERVKRVPLPDGDTFTLLIARHLCKGCTQELAEAAQRARTKANHLLKGEGQ
jgi:hypothetical protein